MKLTRRQKGLLGIVFISGLIVLSWIGLSKLYPESNTWRYLPDRIYRIIKIGFGSDPSATSLEAADIPWELIVAKIFTVVILLFGAYKIIQKVFAEQYTLLLASFKKNHYISIGISKKGRQLLHSLKEDKKQKAIAIEKDTTHAEVPSVKKEGHTVIIGDAEEETTLLEAGITRASRLIVFLDNEQSVIEITESVRRIYEKQQCENTLHCHIHLRNPRLIDLVKNTGIQLKGRNLDLHFFNIQKMVARQFFTQVITDMYYDKKPLENIRRIVFLGFGDFAKALLLQTMRIFHVSTDNILEIVVYGENSSNDEAAFKENYPHASNIFPIRFESFQGTFSTLIHREELQEKSGQTIFIVAKDDDQTNLNHALEMLSRTHIQSFPIYTLNTEGKGLRSLINKSEETSRLKFFGRLEETGAVEFITGEKQDRLAQAIHDDYQKKISGAVSESVRYTSDWHTLSEDAKDANRAQADHILIKFALTNKLTGNMGAIDLRFTEEEVERLAMIEHNRWMAHRYLHGWTYGETRDDDLKLHPSLVPWEALTEGEKQKDRDTIVRLATIWK